MNSKLTKNPKSANKPVSRIGKISSITSTACVSRPVTKKKAAHESRPEKVALSKKSSKCKRNHSLEGNYADENSCDKKSKRNNSLIETKYTEEAWDATKIPYPPALVIRLFSKFLTYYEQCEILNYKNIYHIAAGINKLEANPQEINNGFDDERNDLILIKNDHLFYRYEVLEILGRGSYGQVIKAYDHKEKKLIALKIIRNLSCIIHQAKIEIQILYKLILPDPGNRFVVSIIEHFIFRNHICLTFDLLDITLYQYLKSRISNPLSLLSIRNITEQILLGMKFYHSLGILHCDLKPENIMLTADKAYVKIIDFGSGCFSNKKAFTYIQSRFYRAPEIILQIGYDVKIDMWSLGCIIAELIMGKPLFVGRDEIDQFLAIMEILGMPPSHMMEKSAKKENILKSLKKAAHSGKLRTPASKSLKALLSSNDMVFLDFISSKIYIECLAWDPNDRLSAEDALKHEFFNKNFYMQHVASLPTIKLERVIHTSSSQKKITSEEKIGKKIR